MAARDGTRGSKPWAFVTNHLLVLLCIARDSDARITDVADRLGLTERSVQGIVGDLVDAGYLARERVGRRNHYRIDRALPLRHLETQHQQLGALLRLLEQAPDPND